MVYKLTSMNKKTKVFFFGIIWIFAILCATIGTIFIATAAILPQTPYVIETNKIIGEICQEMGPIEALKYNDFEMDQFYWNVTLRVEREVIRVIDEFNKPISPLVPWQIQEI